MNSNDGEWFYRQYNLLEFNLEEDIRSFNDGPYTYQIAGDRATATFKMPKQSFALLVLNAKIGADEIERARLRAEHPNVQAAYDAYVTLLALSKKYD